MLRLFKEREYMASVMELKTQQEKAAIQAAQDAQAAQNANAAAAATPAAVGNTAPAPALTNLKGLSENTTNKLNQYSQGYTASGSVQAAQDYLNGVLNKKPVADANLSALYDKIMNREEFTYDLNGDMLYQQYKDRYQNMGKQAMMDTMGNATALTGGYGSSYASTAGNQAYQQWLMELNNMVPELHNAALNRYNQQGADMMNRYNMAYGQHRDAVADWENERNFANSDYWQKYEADYADYQNMLNYWNQMAQMENSAYFADRDYAYNLAMQMISQRRMPSAEILAMAGLTAADANLLMPPAKSSGGGSKKSSYKPDTDDEEKDNRTALEKIADTIKKIMPTTSNSHKNFYSK